MTTVELDIGESRRQRQIKQRARRVLQLAMLGMLGLTILAAVMVSQELPAGRTVYDPLEQAPVGISIVALAVATLLSGHIAWVVIRTRGGVGTVTRNPMLVNFMILGEFALLALPAEILTDTDKNPVGFSFMASAILLVFSFIPLILIWGMVATWSYTAEGKKLRASQIRDPELIRLLQEHYTPAGDPSKETAPIDEFSWLQKSPTHLPGPDNPIVAQMPAAPFLARLAGPMIFPPDAHFCLGLRLRGHFCHGCWGYLDSGVPGGTYLG